MRALNANGIKSFTIGREVILAEEDGTILVPDQLLADAYAHGCTDLLTANIPSAATQVIVESGFEAALRDLGERVDALTDMVTGLLTAQKASGTEASDAEITDAPEKDAAAGKSKK